MRGDAESKCLDIVKKTIFYEDDQPKQNPVTHKTYLDVSEDEFRRDRIWLVNPKCHKSYFGLLEHDREEFENALRIAYTNPNASHFPDFIFKNGFIEHFRVTSSSVTRKGATHAKKESEFHHTVNTETKTIESEWNKIPSFDIVRSKTWTLPNPIHTYEFLSESFRSNWEHHLESYKKYNDSKEIGIFMVEYPEFALAMCENVYHDWIDGMSEGDMREQEKFKEYRLSRDKNLLDYVYQFRGKIKYVIFVNLNRIEVICVENIPYLIKLLPWKYNIYSLQVTTLSSLHNISIPAPHMQGDEVDD